MIHRRRVSNRRRSTVRRPDGAQTAPLLPSRTARPPRLPLPAQDVPALAQVLQGIGLIGAEVRAAE